MVLSEWTIPRFLFCKHHVSNLFVLQTPPIAPPIAQSPLPPSHFWWVFNRSFFFSHDFVHKFVHHEEFGGDCFFYCRCVITVPYVFGLHGTVVSLHAVYSTVCTMVGVSLPYCLHVLLQYTPHGTVVSVHPFYPTQVLIVLPSCWCIRLQHHTTHDVEHCRHVRLNLGIQSREVSNWSDRRTLFYCDQLPRVTIWSDCCTCGLYRDWPPRVPDRWMR